MNPVILFRRSLNSRAEEEREIAAAQQAGLPVIFKRTDIERGQLVVGRYSVLPYYRELAEDVAKLGGTLINSYSDHRFIADLSNWYEVLGPGLTPRTWTRLEELPEVGPFVLKGETNSRKDRWATHMYATTRRDAIAVACRLREDGLLSSQAIYVRQFLRLKQLAVGLCGMPVANEYRFFCLDNKILASAFYWSTHVDELGPKPTPSAAIAFVDEIVLPRLVDQTRFVVVDVAEDESGRFWVIELNDGQMSGLAENDPVTLYGALAAALGNGGSIHQ